MAKTVLRFFNFIAISSLCYANGCGSNATVNSSDVNEDKIFQNYSADYNSDTKELTLFAQFTLGNSTGTTLHLSDPSNVTVDGQAMPLVDGETNSVNIIGTYYRLPSTVETPNASYTFKYTRADGKSYTNTLSMASVPSLTTPAADATISKAQDLILTFAGDDLQSNETVYFHLVSKTSTSSENSQVETAASVSISSGKTGKISKADLADFASGPATIYVHRLQSSDIQEGNAGVGGRIYSYSRSTSINVIVGD